jgi:cytidylate kinase
MSQPHRGPAGGEILETPLHGNQGDREPGPLPGGPEGLTVAVSREAGARGTTIAKRVGKKLGWDVYTQEHLEFLSANETARGHVLTGVPSGAAVWAGEHLDRLRSTGLLNLGTELGELPRLILTLAARGRVILVGRGAGFVLPRESTLHVRVVAPLEDRIAHMAQQLRLTRDAAADQVRQRDEQRVEFLVKHFQRRFSDLYDYDLVLNSRLLGEELSAELIAAAIRGKERILERSRA